MMISATNIKFTNRFVGFQGSVFKNGVIKVFSKKYAICLKQLSYCFPALYSAP